MKKILDTTAKVLVLLLLVACSKDNAHNDGRSGNYPSTLRGTIYYDWKQLEKREFYEQRKYTKKPTYEFPLFEDPSPEQGYPVKPFASDYHSIQYDFPENYGIGERGIPHPEDKDYQLKVLQLKAYLLIFDHLMADQLQQVKNTATLFELSEQLPTERLPDVHITDGEHLVDRSKKTVVTEQEKQTQFYRSQKFRYLNLLMYRHMSGLKP